MSKSKKEVNDVEFSLETQIRDDFEEELENLNFIYDELCDLDDETYEHFQAIKQSHGKGTLSFVHLQTSNIIALKNAKIKIISDRTSIKKSIYETINKTKDKDGEGSSASVQDQMKAMYDIIKQDDELSGEVNTDDDVVVNKTNKKIITNNGSNLDERMKQIMGDNPDFLSDNEQNLRFEGKNVSLQVKRFKVKGKNVRSWKFIAVDTDGNVITDYVLPMKKNYDMNFTTVDGELKAVDQNDRLYDLYS